MTDNDDMQLIYGQH